MALVPPPATAIMLKKKKKMDILRKEYCTRRGRALEAFHEEGESLPNTRRSRPSLNDDPSLCATFTLLVVLASSTSGDHHFCEIVTLCRPPPHQDWVRARAAGNRFARDDKEPGPSWGKQLPGERPRETAET